MGAKQSSEMKDALKLFRLGISATGAAKSAGVTREALYRNPQYKVLRDLKKLKGEK